MTWQCGWENAQKGCEAVSEPRVIWGIHLLPPTLREGSKRFLSGKMVFDHFHSLLEGELFSEAYIFSGNWAQQRPVFRGCAGARWDHSLSSKTISNRKMESLKLNFLLLANWQLPDYYRNVVTNSYQSVILNLIFQLYSYISSVRSDNFFFM